MHAITGSKKSRRNSSDSAIRSRSSRVVSPSRCEAAAGASRVKRTMSATMRR